MFDEDRGIYNIGAVSELIGEHPETIRVWERNSIIRPDRSQYRRRYSNNDLKRLRFIKHLLEAEGLNLAGVRHLTKMYPCWYIQSCKGGAAKNSHKAVNESKRCWKEPDTFCLVIADKTEACSTCDMLKQCHVCSGCR